MKKGREGKEREMGQREGERGGGRGGSITGNFSAPASDFLATALLG